MNKQDIPDDLKRQDWNQYTCQCDHKHICTNVATHVVYTHAIDACDKPGLDPDGNVVRILCEYCVMNMREYISERLSSVRRVGLIFCSCGHPLNNMFDIIRRIEPLR